MSGGQRSPVLSVEGLWKAYPRWSAGGRTVRAMLQRQTPLRARRGPHMWALQDVSFELANAEAIGVIGANGAGKSTLLRLAAGLGRPTRGSRWATSDLAAILSLGGSVDLTLTGRENAATMGRVLGLSRGAAVDAVPAVIEFAELEAFEDAPVRTYSEGMKLRLAFGVVAQLRPQLLVVDEVLTVGDLRFQEKCLDHVRRMREHGMALVLASHDLEQVAAHCDRALWMHRGQVRRTGPTHEVLAAYRAAMHSETVAKTPSGDAIGALELGHNRFGSQEMRITDVRVMDATGALANEITPDSSFSVELDVEGVGDGGKLPIAGVSLSRAADHLICVDVNSESAALRRPGEQRITFRAEFPATALAAGDYRLSVGIYVPGWDYAYDYHWEAYPLRVLGPIGSGAVRIAPRWTLTTRDPAR